MRYYTPALFNCQLTRPFETLSPSSSFTPFTAFTLSTPLPFYLSHLLLTAFFPPPLVAIFAFTYFVHKIFLSPSSLPPFSSPLLSSPVLPSHLLSTLLFFLHSCSSVEEIVTESVMRTLQGSSCKMHPCGREDIDVRCLG